MAKVISIINHKGGVGKTTTTLNLGKALAQNSSKVLMIDMDPQGNLSQICNIHTPEVQVVDAILDENKLPAIFVSENLYISPSNLELVDAELALAMKANGVYRLKRSISSIINTKEFDYVLIDCPPSLNVLTQNAMVASNDLIITVEPTYLASNGLDRVLDVVEEIKQDINHELNVAGIVFTMVDKRLAIQRDIKDQVSTLFGKDIPIYKTVIHRSVSLQEAAALCTDIFTHSPKSIAAQDYHDLAKEISNHG
ncbi:ParA family protein [Aureibacter tunicatorum]|uniref:Chromosome partitioning protein n=1 Tax=Aureibacter tunicatorum TaxID=866807 RepID=A0AAE4BT21_9BACT|nr:ParA family protein [Aureibacter tunicatorum]MDR6241764.1 chromosome partitioning protein [Aureibacter tunicatorum]BDD07375.1 sporulation initiation inhibitor protein Soj [Aureibacter tunicatorum]